MRVLIAMSGGLDSAAATYLLQQQGHAVAGATLLLHNNESACQSAADSAARLGLTHMVLDRRALFREEVMRRFCRIYREGGTPNPCVDCNIHVKFGALLPYALEQGFDRVASGHYARLEQANGRTLLKRGVDATKDQSYVLYGLDQQILSHLLLPLGGMTKKEIRALAAQERFVDPALPESQDICFVPDGDYAAFIARFDGLADEEGDFLDAAGQVVGRHRGQLHYTIGQRKGLGLALGTPLYVCGRDAAHNTVTVGGEALLYTDTLLAGELNWIALERFTAPLRCTVKTRYRQDAQPALVEPVDDGRVLVRFDHPQKAIAPGQSAVLYDGEYVIGGGVILSQ